MSDPQSLLTILDVAGNLTTVGFLVVVVWLFMRGDLLPRKVYEELTSRLMKELVANVSKEIRDIVDKLNKDKGET